MTPNRETLIALLEALEKLGSGAAGNVSEVEFALARCWRTSPLPLGRPPDRIDWDGQLDPL